MKGHQLLSQFPRFRLPFLSCSKFHDTGSNKSFHFGCVYTYIPHVGLGVPADRRHAPHYPRSCSKRCNVPSASALVADTGGCLGILTNLQAAKLRNVLGLNIGKHPNEFNGLRWLKMILFKQGCQKVNIKHDLLF